MALNINKKTGDRLTAEEINQIGSAVDKNTQDIQTNNTKQAQENKRLDKIHVNTTGQKPTEENIEVYVDFNNEDIDDLICPEAPDAKHYVRTRSGWVEAYTKLEVDQKIAELRALIGK